MKLYGSRPIKRVCTGILFLLFTAWHPIFACNEVSLERTENALSGFLFTEVTLEYVMMPRSATDDWKLYMAADVYAKAGRHFSGRDSFLKEYLSWCVLQEYEEAEPIVFARRKDGSLFAWSFVGRSQEDWNFWVSSYSVWKSPFRSGFQFWGRSRRVEDDGFVYSIDYSPATLTVIKHDFEYIISQRQYEGDICDEGDRKVIGHLCRTDRALRFRLKDGELTGIEVFDEKKGYIYYAMILKQRPIPSGFRSCQEKDQSRIHGSDRRGFGSAVPFELTMLEGGQCIVPILAEVYPER